MDSRGMTVVELLVTVAIIAIVLVVAGFEFFGWQAKYKVESEIKELQTVFMDTRMRARQMNTMYFIKFDKTSDDKPSDEARRECIVYEDRDPYNGKLDVNYDLEVDDLTKKALSYRLDWDGTGGSNPVGDKIVFVIDRKGFVSMEKLDGTSLKFPEPHPRTVANVDIPAFMKLWLVDPGDRRYIKTDIPSSADRPDVSYDCLSIMETRVNIGKLNDGGDSCDEK